jgi:flagellar basal-body rod protein FlgB
MPEILFDPTLQGLARAMSLLQRRHEVLTSNLANLETPGYRAKELDFDGALREAFDAAAPGGGDDAAPAEVVADATAPARADGNTVDLDLQMAKLGQNGGRYVALAKLLGRRIALLRLAMEGPR